MRNYVESSRLCHLEPKESLNIWISSSRWLAMRMDYMEFIIVKCLEYWALDDAFECFSRMLRRKRFAISVMSIDRLWATLQRVSITSRWRPKSFVFYILISESLEQQQEWLVGILVPKTYLTEMLEHSSGLLNATHSSQTRPVYKSHAWNLQKRWTLWKPRARKHIFFQVFFLKWSGLTCAPFFTYACVPRSTLPDFNYRRKEKIGFPCCLAHRKFRQN